jgi:hypothetical protein
MSTTPITLGLSLETDLAILQVESEQANYASDSAILEAARAAKRAHDREQVDDLRDKASHLMTSGIVQGALLVGSGVTQALSATSQYAADMDRAHTAANCPDACKVAPTLTEEGAAAQRNANLCGAAAKTLEGGSKATDLAFNSIATGDDADAAAASHEAEDAKCRADDAASARQRDQARLDQNISVIEEMLRSDHDTMRNLLRPA